MAEMEKTCPECGYVFRGSGWDGFDAHWRAKHEDIMPYEEAWPMIQSGRYRKEKTWREIKRAFEVACEVRRGQKPFAEILTEDFGDRFSVKCTIHDCSKAIDQITRFTVDVIFDSSENELVAKYMHRPVKRFPVDAKPPYELAQVILKPVLYPLYP